MKKQPYLVLGLLVAVSFFIFSFSSADSSESSDDSTYSREKISLQATLVDGSTLDLSAYKDKVVILDFWATWCPPCVAEIPHFIALQKKYGKDLQIIGISVDKKHDTLKAFIDEKNINYPVVHFDPKMDEQFGSITGIPTTFVLDREHRIVDKAVGFHAQEYFESKITPLLKCL